MMAGVLTVEFGTVVELTLQGFTQKWVEWLVLTATHVYRTNSKGDDELEPLEMVVGLGSLPKVLWCEGPQVTNSLDGGSWLKNLDRQRNMGNTQTLEHVYSKLFGNM